MYKFLFIFLFINYSVQAQTKISGKIIDNKNKPVPGISITLKNTYDGTTSDSSGNFSFSTDEKGTQTLEASATGYKPFEQPINLTGNAIAS